MAGFHSLCCAVRVYSVATVRTCSSTVFLFTEIEYVSYKSVLDDAKRRQPLVKVKNEDLFTFCAPRVDNMQFMTHTVCDVVSEYFTGYQTSQRKCLECETSVKYVIRFVRCGSRCFRVYAMNYTMLAELSIERSATSVCTCTHSVTRTLYAYVYTVQDTRNILSTFKRHWFSA